MEIYDSGGYHTPEHPPHNEKGQVKMPIDDLEHVMSVDGRGGRRVITINDRFSGPVIKVRQGAVVKVIVHNNLPNQAATVHWHGLFQTDNYWMDGAAFVNQCPINAYQTFTYVWKAEHAGTYWYHSHNSIQRMDGLFGGIVVYDKNDTVKVGVEKKQA